MITRKEITQVQEKARQIKALVIGDAMIDKYIYGVVERISPEAPVPILSHRRSDIRAGGAANVALNLAAWGCEVSLIALAGKDDNADTLGRLLDESRIKHYLLRSEKRPTTIKTRVVASSHHLLRIDEESNDYLSGEEEARAISHVISHTQALKPDLIILEDYNKGFLTGKMISAVLAMKKQHKAFIAVDPKELNFFQYSGVDLFKPNLREASHAAHQSLKPDDLSDVCTEWQNKMNINTIAITLGSQGIFLRQGHTSIHLMPDRSVDVVDVCGAGDAVICSLALGMISGLDIKASGALANRTGAYVCSHSGVVTVNVEDL